MEGGRGGFSSWIRFGEIGLSQLLERVELFCMEEKGFLGPLEWEEEGRRFKLQCHSNGAGRFIQCS